MLKLTKIFKKPEIKVKNIKMCAMCKVEQALRLGKYCVECKEEAVRISRRKSDRKKKSNK